MAHVLRAAAHLGALPTNGGLNARRIAAARPRAQLLASRNDEQATASQQQHPGSMFAAAVLAAAVLTGHPNMALAAEDAAATVGSAAVPTAYFGNGCFWGRQKDFVDTEQRLGRTSPADISALVGYAGGQKAGPDGKVCYYFNGDPRTIYERLGHAEVVQVALSQQQQSAQQEFK
eukprot:GHRQ01027712.1.p1 GENE.GHRQ01027712.1~~GHRQ01027712.1.p1  ORF type:complete len:175 (+),score=80.37 GHRQ01027712.1:84-608(+)